MTPPVAIDLLIEARWIIPVEPAGITLEHHAVAVRDGLIEAILPQSEARNRYAPAEHVMLGDDHVLIPGLINLHTHAAMSLLRGIADDLPLMRWLQEAIWPAEAAHVSPSFVRDGTRLAAAEMLRGGITTAADMYFFPNEAAEAFAEAGMRASVGLTVIEFPTAYATDADDYLRKGIEVRDQWRDHPLVSFALAPHAPYTVSDASFERIRVLAEEIQAPVQMHIHETREEIQDSLRQHGVRPLQRLERLGMVGAGLIGVHCVHLTEAEIALFAERNVAVAHNPTSNMKLASGIAPVAQLLAKGVAVGLGTDGAASNNRLDMFQEMRHAALLAKVSSQDAAVVPAHTALRMATLDGARALGLDALTGSLRAGKAADLCAVSLFEPAMQPCFDPASHLVYVADRGQVSDVWVAGQRRVAGGRLMHIEDSELRAIAGSRVLSLSGTA